MNQVVLFDLFGTLVHFGSEVPTLELGGQRWRSTMHWLGPAVAQYLPHLEFDTFLQSLLSVTREIVSTRAPEYHEVTSLTRFRRTLERLGVPPSVQDDVAPVLVRVHMAQLSQRACPDPHASAVLTALRAAGYRTGVVSNFDHEATARDILQRYHLLPLLDTVVISAGFGRRKPHPSIFHHALTQLVAHASQACFVGDNFDEDVLGASRAGLQVLWLSSEDAQGSQGDTPVEGARRIASLAEVLPALGIRTNGPAHHSRLP